MASNNQHFENINKFYKEYKDLFFRDLEESIKNKKTAFKNSNYLHWLYLTDYALSKTENRLCISTKGFLKPYEALKESIKKAIERARQLFIVSSSKDKKVEAFFKSLGIKDEEFILDEKDELKHFIITDNCFRKSTGKGCTEGTSFDQIRADVTFSKEIADTAYENLEIWRDKKNQS